MQTKRVGFGLVMLLAVVIAAPDLRGHGNDHRDHRGDVEIAVIDDCDPDDPNWANAPGGCVQDKGDVSLLEFNQFLVSPLYGGLPPAAGFVVGHPSWRNEPGHVTIREGRKIRVKNEGGRPHTFTEVAEFGGGRAGNPLLNRGLTLAPACAAPTPPATDPSELAPGRRLRITAENAGIHKFQCCFHPWMRATIRVVEKNDHSDH